MQAQGGHGHRLQAAPFRIARAWWPAAALLALAVTGGVPRKAAQLNQDANKAFVEKDYDAADRLYDEAQVKAPNTAELSYNRGNVLYKQGKFGDAAANLRRAAISTDPVLRQKSLYNLGNALHDLGELEMAAKSYREALKLNPADRDAKINYEKTLREMKENPQQKKQQQQQNQNQQNKDNKDEKQGGQGQQGEDQKDKDSQDQDGQDEQAQKQDDAKQQDAKEKQGQQEQEQQGEGKDEKQKPQPDDSQLAGMDSIPVEGLTREEALRILEAMRDQEKELQKQKARQVKARSRRVDKDW